MAMNVNLGDAGGGEDGEGSESVVAEINITPLTDVFLVLLIIFMVTANAMVETESASKSGIKVALPRANAAGSLSNKRTDPVVTITKSGQLFVYNKPTPPADLEAAIRSALQDVGSETVIIRGDTSVTLGSSVNVMGVARQAGAKNISLLTETGGSHP